MTKIRTTVVSYEDFSDLGFKDPATWYIRLATGDYLYIHTREREDAQKYINEHYCGKYILRTNKINKNKPKIIGHDITARG